MPPQKPESPLSSPARRPTGLGIPSTIQIVIAGKSDGFERRPPDPPWVMLPERGERSLFLFLALQSNEPIRIANANAQGLVVDSLGRAPARLFHVDSRKALMHEASLGDRLSRAEIEQMNPSGTTINPF